MKEVDTFVTVENVSYLLCDRNTFTTAKHLHSTFLCDILYKKSFHLRTKQQCEQNVEVKKRYMCNKMISSKHEKELLFWKFALLNAYINIYNIEQM